MGFIKGRGREKYVLMDIYGVMIFDVGDVDVFKAVKFTIFIALNARL